MEILLSIFVISSFFYLPLDARHSSSHSNNDTDSSEEAQLIFANVIFRHGDRNPLSSYPTDPWKNESNWPSGFGRLTILGIKQEYELGKYFHRRYASLFDDGNYLNDVVYVRSTDYERTLMSASACMAGLFPPSDEQTWNQHLTWQPIPIHTVPIEMDYILHARTSCSRYNWAMQKYLESPEYTAIIAKHQQLFQYLEEKTESRVQSLDDVQTIYNTLWIQKLKNKTLPDWTNEVFGDGSDFEWCANRDFQLQTNTPELARLSTGFLIRQMLEHFSRKIKSTLLPDRSLWIYSAHDTNIANILNSLGLFDLHTPPYSSSIHFELYKTEENFYVQIFYRNTSDENPLPLDIPNCGTKCSLDDFQRLYSDIIPTGGFEEECRLPLYLRILEGSDITWPSEYFVASISIAFLVPVLAFISWKLFSPKRGNIFMDNDNMKYL